jgi:PEP-CTERM motif
VCTRDVSAGPIVLSDANPYSFDCITDNQARNCAIIENQLQANIGSYGSFVGFLFTNSGPAASSLTDVYFDDPLGLLGSPTYIVQSSGVKFTKSCSPATLPGDQAYQFMTSYCAESTSPFITNRVNPGESLLSAYTLQGTTTAANVFEAIADGQFEIGINVLGFSGGGSESEHLIPEDVVSGIETPEPGSLFLLGSGLALIVRRHWRRAAAAIGE